MRVASVGGLRVLFTRLPPAFAIYYWRRFFTSEMADYVFGRHARAASGEMRELATTVAPSWKRAISRLLCSASFTVQSMPSDRRGNATGRAAPVAFLS